MSDSAAVLEAVQELKALVTAKRDAIGADAGRSDYADRDAQAKAWAYRDGGSLTVARIMAATRGDAMAGDRMVPEAPDYSAANLRGLVDEDKKIRNADVTRAFEWYLATKPRTAHEAEHHDLATKVGLLTAAMRVFTNDPGWLPARSRSIPTRMLWRSFSTLQREMFGEVFLQRAFDSVEVSTWVPTATTSQLIRWFEVSGSVLPNFLQYAMPAGQARQPFLTVPAPGVAGVPADSAPARRVTELTALQSGGYNWSAGQLYPAGAMPAGAAVFDKEVITARIHLSGDFTEESAVPALDQLGRLAGAECRRGVEDATLNGGTVVNEPDVDLVVAPIADGSTLARAAWKGIRENIRVNTAYVAAAALDKAAWRLALKKLTPRYITWPPSLMCICGAKGFVDMVAADLFLPAGQLGVRADIPVGAVGTYAGVGVVISEFVRENLNANGFYDALTTDKTAHIIVNRDAWMLGTFKGVRVEPVRLPAHDQNVLVGTWKGDLQRVVATADKTEAQVASIATY